MLIPALRRRPDAAVARDDPAAHQAEAVPAAPEAAGIDCRRLPARSPDPIEPRWSELKAHLRPAGARSREALEAALGPALDAITARDARGRFRHAGHPAPD